MKDRGQGLGVRGRGLGLAERCACGDKYALTQYLRSGFRLLTAHCSLLTIRCSLLALVLLFACSTLSAQTKRVVVIKVDGLSDGMVDEFVHERDPRTGKSLLPWIEHVFYERGTRLANFYVRGMSLSASSWS